MPTYEYACTQCGHTFEEFQSIVAEPFRECPKCTGRLERLINGGAGLIFKGSGFYLTDYKKSNVVGGNNDRSDSINADEKKDTTKVDRSGEKASSASPKT